MAERYAYYPGCWLSGAASGYGESFERVCDALDITLDEIDGWTCCGATSAHAVAPRAALALSMENLRLAAATGRPVVAPCAICYSNLISARYAAGHGDPELEHGLPDVDAAALAAVEVLSPLDLLASPATLARVYERIVERLSGLRVAAYYGCLLTRPPWRVGMEGADMPLSMERLVETLGAAALDWVAATDCCGAALAVPAADVVLGLVAGIIDSARDAGANCIATACPLCQWNLDIYQYEISKRLRRKVEMPVFYFTELVAMAFDLPRTERWLKRHMTTVFPLLDEVIEFE